MNQDVDRQKARREIAELIEKFEAERNWGQSEADVRAGYIDLLFKALGWNVYNDPGEVTNYRREGYVRGAGYVDVGLEIRGQPVLFLEAKRFRHIPASSERTGDRTTEEKQAFRYARGKKITYAILTNFERLHLFNADHERLIHAFDSPQEYLGNFEALWRLSPGEVERGSLSWWEGQLGKRDVDLEFLSALRRWRLLLARAIYEHNSANPELRTNGSFNFDRLMEAVQRILDRLILIRYGDDKEVLLTHDLLDSMLADYRNRGAYARSDHLMGAFIDLCHMMDEHHNTTLFTSGHICEKVTLPNETLAQVIDEMNRISFRKFTSDILGNTYESYLGTKLTLRNGQIADEERRDIRKGRGIYYTPRWVVEYIVDNTLGRRLKELEEEHGFHAIEKVRGLAVLDPACGSGSFLIYAYQVLADFYRRLNQAILDEQTRLVKDLADPDMFQRLERLKHLPQPVLDYSQVILKEHLFGVDLDPEAAEIAAVNLTMQAFADSRQKKLPLILNENIKVGNSLISGGETELRPYFGDAWREKHPLNWEQEFPEVMARGGFDVVIGNPPYGSKKMLTPEEKAFVKDHVRCTASSDMAEFFISRTVVLLKEGGLHGFIVPKPLTYITSWQQIREFLTSQSLENLVDVSRAFEDVLLEQVILVFRKQLPTEVGVPTALALSGGQIQDLGRVGRHLFDKRIFPLYLTSDVENLVSKLWGNSEQLSNIAHIFAGIGGVTPKLTIDNSLPGKECLRGNNIDRYTLSKRPIFLLLDGSYSQQDLDEHALPRIVCQDIVAHIERPKPHIKITATLDLTGRLTHETVINIALKPEAQTMFDLHYLLGLINSRLISWYVYRFIFNSAIRTMHFRPGYADYTPIRRIDFSNPDDKAMHDRLVALVERMLGLHKRLAAKGEVRDEERAQIEREIARTDREIDNLVYDLYGLTEEERRLVEEGST